MTVFPTVWHVLANRSRFRGDNIQKSSSCPEWSQVVGVGGQSPSLGGRGGGKKGKRMLTPPSSQIRLQRRQSDQHGPPADDGRAAELAVRGDVSGITACSWVELTNPPTQLQIPLPPLHRRGPLATRQVGLQHGGAPAARV